MPRRFRQRALGLVATIAALVLAPAPPALASDPTAVRAVGTRTVFYQAIVGGEHLPWASNGDLAGRFGQPMEAMWILPWGGGEICATVSIPGFGWQNWRCAQPGDSFRVGTVGYGLTMNGFTVKTQFGSLCFRAYISTPGNPISGRWRDTFCTRGPGLIGMPAGNYQIEVLLMYYES
jgi:hypothetical protein